MWVIIQEFHFYPAPVSGAYPRGFGSSPGTPMKKTDPDAGSHGRKPWEPIMRISTFTSLLPWNFTVIRVSMWPLKSDGLVAKPGSISYRMCSLWWITQHFCVCTSSSVKWETWLAPASEIGTVCDWIHEKTLQLFLHGVFNKCLEIVAKAN